MVICPCLCLIARTSRLPLTLLAWCKFSPLSPTDTQLRLELEQSQAAYIELTNVQIQLNVTIQKLEVSLANQTAALEAERTAKWEISKERYKREISHWVNEYGMTGVTGTEPINKWVNQYVRYLVGVEMLMRSFTFQLVKCAWVFIIAILFDY